MVSVIVHAARDVRGAADVCRRVPPVFALCRPPLHERPSRLAQGRQVRRLGSSSGCGGRRAAACRGQKRPKPRGFGSGALAPLIPAPAARAAARPRGARCMARGAAGVPRFAARSGAQERKPFALRRSRVPPRPRRSRAPLTPCRTRWTRRRRCGAATRSGGLAPHRCAAHPLPARCGTCAPPDAAPGGQMEESCKPQCVKALLAYQARPARAALYCAAR